MAVAEKVQTDDKLITTTHRSIMTQVSYRILPSIDLCLHIKEDEYI